MKYSDSTSLDEKLFRHSYAKTVAVLVRYFGLNQVETAEDIVQETLMDAFQQWSTHGAPHNPEGWIMDVAKKKTINLLRRNQVLQTKVLPRLKEYQSTPQEEIEDSTLKMIFACCHPDLPKESQIALSLKTLCGLSISEISSALLSSTGNINKRLYRAKEKFRSGKIPFIIPEEKDYDMRLDSVCKTLYLLFNEGYYAPHHTEIIRTDLCFEALRLLKEIASRFSQSGKVSGLLALMYFSLARFESRLNEFQELVCIQDQDRSLWDKQFIGLGMKYLMASTQQGQVNSYQLQAGIAAEHCLATRFETTNWHSIYGQYEVLENIEGNDLVKMNKLIAYFYLGNEQTALDELQKLSQSPVLKNNASFYLTLGVLFGLDVENTQACFYMKKAMNLAKHGHEQQIIQRKLAALDCST